MPVFAHTYLPKRRHPKTSYLFCITYFHYIFLSVFEKLNSALCLFGVEFTFSNEVQTVDAIPGKIAIDRAS
jgi:hypothetical protein